MSDENVKPGINLFIIMILLLISFIHSYKIDQNKERIEALEHSVELLNTPKEAQP